MENYSELKFNVWIRRTPSTYLTWEKKAESIDLDEAAELISCLCEDDPLLEVAMLPEGHTPVDDNRLNGQRR